MAITDYSLELKSELTALADSIRSKSGVSGTLTVAQMKTAVDGISGGGGGDSGGQYLVQVIDYDGTVLKQDHLNEGDTFTLPEAPTRDSRLVFQSWSSPVSIVNNAVTVGNSDITIGPMYKTVSGATEFDITLTKVTGKTVTFQNLTGMTSIDWGDEITNNSLSHTYADEGDYTIKIYGLTSLGQYIFSQSSSNMNYFCKSARISENVTSLGMSCFQCCCSLSNITLSDNINSIASSCFYKCQSLTMLVIPQGVSTLSYACVYECRSLKNIVLPTSITTIGGSAFFSCFSLERITIPAGVTSLGISIFQNCYAIKRIILQNNITDIDSNCFYQCISIIVYDFTNCTEVPALESTNVFNGINKSCKFLIPAELYYDWIEETNWTTYVDYLYPVGELPDPPQPDIPTLNVQATVGQTYSETLSWYISFPTGTSGPYPDVRLYLNGTTTNLIDSNNAIDQNYFEMYGSNAYLSSDWYSDGVYEYNGYYIYNFTPLVAGTYEWIGYNPDTNEPINRYIMTVGS